MFTIFPIKYEFLINYALHKPLTWKGDFFQILKNKICSLIFIFNLLFF